MIDFLKKKNTNVMCVLIGIAVSFSMLGSFILVQAGAYAYLFGMSYGTFVIVITIFSVVIFSLLAKLFAYLSFRIAGGIFTRNNGMISPFPIGYQEYVSTVLALALPCFLLCGLIELPVLFYPTLASVLGAIHTFVQWCFLALGAYYFVKKNGHDYDRRSLAISLSVIPLVIIGISLIVNIVRVIR